MGNYILENVDKQNIFAKTLATWKVNAGERRQIALATTVEKLDLFVLIAQN